MKSIMLAKSSSENSYLFDFLFNVDEVHLFDKIRQLSISEIICNYYVEIIFSLILLFFVDCFGGFGQFIPIGTAAGREIYKILLSELFEFFDYRCYVIVQQLVAQLAGVAETNHRNIETELS